MNNSEFSPIKSLLDRQPDRKETCATHGEYVSRNVFGKVWSKCPDCAAIEKAERDQEEAEKIADEKRRAWQKKLGQADIPERFHTRTLTSYKIENDGQRRAHRFATAFAEQFSNAKGRSAIFCGSPGTGKTHLAVGIGLHIMARGDMAMFTTVQRAVRRVKDSWRKDSTESESDVIKLMVEPALLILDEVGVQFGTEFEKNLMFDILNERYEKQRSTILLSNLTAQEVKSFLGDRVFDRLREGGGQCVPFTWESHRK
jgi:DNA replication protein DnaC